MARPLLGNRIGCLMPNNHWIIPRTLVTHIKGLGQPDWAQYMTAFTNTEIHKRVVDGWMDGEVGSLLHLCPTHLPLAIAPVSVP